MPLRTHLFPAALLLVTPFLLSLRPACGEEKEKMEKPYKHDPTYVASVTEAVCVVVPTESYSVRGTLVFSQRGPWVEIKGAISGLTPGLHGIHIHRYGDLRNPKGKATGGHYNPDGKPHGGPDSKQRHAGDLGNIEANADGIATVDLRARDLTIAAILGRSIVVHAGEDDLTSQPSGKSGPRVAMGVIGIALPIRK